MWAITINLRYNLSDLTGYVSPLWDEVKYLQLYVISYVVRFLANYLTVKPSGLMCTHRGLLIGDSVK